MESAREHLKSIVEQGEILLSWNDAQLTAYRDQLAAIDLAMPTGQDRACRECAQRLRVSLRVETRDGRNEHCPRHSGGHVPELV